ncbi:hypothetical protein WA026_011908 [Henosepilachna vigintioctopunctata]|uniref:Uncharacterized protein n=1 Tax=Henosepilachna vigintioctopunctata TaxID=420089 RepID=A0AAW1UIM0_9CUCU
MYSSEKIFEEMKVLNLRKLYMKRALMYCFRDKTIIPYAEHTYHTRCKEIITHKVRTSKQIGQRHYSYVIRRLQDMIPQALKNEKDWNFSKNSLENGYMASRV